MAWLGALPALALVGNPLLHHADATFYTAYGTSVAAVNAPIAALLAGDAADRWATMPEQFAARLAFDPRVAGH